MRDVGGGWGGQEGRQAGLRHITSTAAAAAPIHVLFVFECRNSME